jgi:hypothetical protein
MSASSNISSHFIEQDAYYDADTVGEIMTPHRAGNYGNSWGRLDGGGGAGGPRYNEYDETVGPPCDSSDNVAWLLVSLSMLSRGNFARCVYTLLWVVLCARVHFLSLPLSLTLVALLPALSPLCFGIAPLTSSGKKKHMASTRTSPHATRTTHHTRNISITILSMEGNMVSRT